MKFSHNYVLAKDTPTHKRGWPLRWHGGQRKFYFSTVSTWGYNKGEPDIYLDMEGASYTVEQILNTEWFTSNGGETDFIPAFPSEKKLEEYMYLLPELRLVEDVDECRAIADLFKSNGFTNRLYDFYKKEYEHFHQSGATANAN